MDCPFPSRPALRIASRRRAAIAQQLAQFDLSCNLMREIHSADRQHNLRRQLFMALEAAGGQRVAHRFFDFALRGDADFLEESTQAAVEGVFVHMCSSLSRPGERRDPYHRVRGSITTVATSHSK